MAPHSTRCTNDLPVLSGDPTPTVDQTRACQPSGRRPDAG